MIAETVLAYTGVGLFASASVLAVASLVRPTSFGEIGIRTLLAVGCLPLLALLVLRGFEAGGVPAFTRFEALACYGLVVTLAYLHMMIRHQMRGIAAILVPYVCLLLVVGLPTLNTETELAPKLQTAWLGLHILSAFAGYALFSLAAVLAMAYLVQDNNLKRKHFGIVFHRLPALETLDHLMYHQVGIAFLMFTVSILLGIVNVRLSGGGPEWLIDPKVAATIATWGVYAVLMHVRAGGSRHGKGVAVITVVGLAFVLFAFLGVHIVSDSVHNFVLTGEEVPSP